MNAKDAVRATMNTADFMVESYLSDITPEEMLVRPAPSANHLAWQLGHLISAETRLVEVAAPGSMPALPEGFAERHTKDTAASDNPADFLSKDEYLQLAKSVASCNIEGGSTTLATRISTNRLPGVFRRGSSEGVIAS